MKKMLSLVLALIMIVALAAPVMAVSETGNTLTIEHIANNHEFTAYQIFAGEQSGGILSTVVWGSAFTEEKAAAFLNALKTDTTKTFEVHENGETVEKTFAQIFADATNADGVASIVKGFENNGPRLDYFAELAQNYVSSGTTSDAEVTGSEGAYKYTISGLDDGYYLVADTTDNANVGAEDYKTHYMLYLVTDTVIVTKGDYSTVEKTVSDDLNGTYGEYITTQLNMTRYFKWEVELDNDLAEYDEYYLAFYDTMSAGITYLALEEVYIQEVSGNAVYLYKDGDWVVNAEAGINGTPDKYEYTVDADGITSIVLEWNDLKGAYTDVAGDDILVVKYSVKLNENAVYGVEGNPNEVYIEYSNGPESEDHGKSVPDYAYIFSLQLNVLKVDAADTSKTLAGAEFMLYHLHGTEKHYAIVDANNEAISWTTNTPESIAAEIAAVEANEELSAEEKENAIAEINAKPVASVLVTKEDGKINVQGLDADVTYYLTETKAPTGYNRLYNDTYFSATPDYITDTDGSITYKTVKVNVNGTTSVKSATEDQTIALGTISVQVENSAGSTLPHTGGIGTTLFYVFGSVMVLGAAVLLITKKRMVA